MDHEIEILLKRVSSKIDEWKSLSIPKKIELLKQCQSNIAKNAPELELKRMAKNIANVQGLEGNSGEIESFNQSYIFFSVCNGRLQSLIDSLQINHNEGMMPQITPSHEDSTTNALVIPVYPRSFAERMGIPAVLGYTGEIWIKPQNENDPHIETVPRGKAANSNYPGFCLVLAAGNQEFLTFCDVLDRMILHNEVVIIKHHPLREHLDEVYRFILQPLVDLDFVGSIKNSSVSIAEELIRHPLLNHVHLTGGNKTHDAILNSLAKRSDFGASVGFTAELGCVSPWILVPDVCISTHETGATANNHWNDASLRVHANHLAVAVKTNGSANCLSPKVLVLPKDWEFKDKFLNFLREGLSNISTSNWYYPGTQGRWEAFVKEYEGECDDNQKRCEIFRTPLMGEGGATQMVMSAILHVGLNEKNRGGNKFALQNEAFAPVLAIVEITSDDTVGAGDNKCQTYLRTAVKFCNDEIWGTLSCSVMCPWPDGPVKGMLEESIANLEYGSVNVNTWSALSYGISQCTWGAHSGKYKREVGMGGSGCGVVGNSLMLDDSRIIKSVIRAPFLHALQIQGEMPPLWLVEILATASRQGSIFGAIFAITQLLIKKILPFS